MGKGLRRRDSAQLVGSAEEAVARSRTRLEFGAMACLKQNTNVMVVFYL